MRLLLAAALLCSTAAQAATPAEQAAAVFADLKPGAPGCSASVMKDGELVWADGFGTADLATGRRNDAGTIYNVASISKQFTAFAILQLEAAGKLSQDDSITRFFPELGAYARPVTVRHLLHHTGGLRDYTFFANLAGIPVSAKLTEKDGLDLILKQDGPEFPAGSEWSYSNTGYFLLSVIVERVTGQTMKAYAAANIFGPLGMKESSFVDAYPTAIPALARGYARDGEHWKVDESGWEMTGDGQVHTTVKDLMLWEDNLATGKVGGPALVEKMRIDGRLNDGEAVNYGTGLGLGTYRGLAIVEHSGGWAGYNSDAVWFPAARVSASVLCNTFGLDPGKRTRALAAIWVGDRFRPEGNEPPAPIPPRVARAARLPLAKLMPGVYAAADGSVVEIGGKPGALTVIGFGDPAPIRAGAGNVLQTTFWGEPVYLAAPAEGQLVSSRSKKPFTRLVPPATPAIDRYVGRYGITGMKGALEIARAGDGLVIKLAEETIPLVPVGPDRLKAGYWGLVTFSPDAATFTAPFARGVTFRRVE